MNARKQSLMIILLFDLKDSILHGIHLERKRKAETVFLMGMVLMAAILLTAGVECRAQEWKLWHSGAESYTYLAGADGTASVIAYQGLKEKLNVPETIDGYRVTGIGAADERGQEYDFSVSASVKELVIPDSVKEVRLPAYQDNLQSLHLGANAEIAWSDGEYLGWGQAKLSRITVSEDNPHYSVRDNVLYSKDGKILYAYPGKRKGKSYTVRKGTELIWPNAFHGCDRLQKVNFPDGLREIGDYAFYVTNLTGIRLPGSVTRIGKDAFSDCSKLKTAVFANGLTEIGESAFSDCSKLKTVKLPDSLKQIGRGAFWDCESLTGTITIPQNVEEIGDDAFTDCTGISRYEVKNPDTAIGTCALGCRYVGNDRDFEGNETSLYRPFKNVSVKCVKESKAYAYAKETGLAFFDTEEKKLLSYRKKTIQVEAPPVVNALLCWKSKKGTFWYELNPDGSAILQDVWSDGRRLEIPEQIEGHTVVSLGLGYALGFQVDGKGIREIVIPDTVEVMDYEGFSYKNIAIRLGAKTLLLQNDREFMNCDRGDISVPAENPYYKMEDGAVYSRDGKVLYAYPRSRKKASYTLKPETEQIYPFAFAGCSRLKKVTFNKKLRVIWNSAFECSGLKQVSFPKSVRKIGAFAFYKTPLSGTVTFPSNVKCVEECAFAGCTKVTEWIVGGGKTVFGHCSIGCSSVYAGDGGCRAYSVKNTEVVAPSKSKAYSYAKKYGLAFYDQHKQKKLSYHKKKEKFYYNY